MDLELTDSVAVVTGASKGIGLAVTKALVEEGARVVAGARGSGALEGLPGVTAVAVDLASPDGPASLVERALDEFGRVEQGGGAIVKVASVNAFFQPDAGTIDYGAAKAALVNLTKTLAQEFGPKGIRVNAVSPGPVSTDLWLGDHGVAETVAAATGVDADTARAAVVESIGGFATGRFTTPEEVATLVVMLASPRTGNVTGSNYVIDGGLIKTT